MTQPKRDVMTWDEFKSMAETMLAFRSLSAEDKERVLLMIDGLKYRCENAEPIDKICEKLLSAKAQPENTVIQGGAGINDIHPMNRQPFLNGAGANPVKAKCGHVVRSGWRCKVEECAKREEAPPSFL